MRSGEAAPTSDSVNDLASLATAERSDDLTAMCGRFVASASPEEVRRWFRTTNPLPNFNASYNVAPTDSIPVVRFNPKTRERSLDLLHSGLIPHW